MFPLWQQIQGNKPRTHGKGICMREDTDEFDYQFLNQDIEITEEDFED
jgi:hypothetical protein